MSEQFAKKHEVTINILGNILEWYNFALFMPFLPIISQRFFPHDCPSLNVVMTFLVMSVGLLMRPLGSMVFGPIGDRFGRRKAISFSIFLMAMPTFCMAILPDYDHIGIWAPIILVLLRAMQGISMGGEYTAAMVHIVEKAPPKYRGFFGSFSDAGSQIGVLLSGQALVWLYSVFSQDEIYDFAWRIPFGCAIILLPFVFLVPKQEKSDIKNKEKTPIIETLRLYTKELFCTVAITSFSAVAFYTLLTFIPYYLANEHILELKDATRGTNIANGFMIVSIVIAGYLSDHFPRKWFLRTGITGACLILSLLLHCHNGDNYMLLCGMCGLFLGLYYSCRAAFFAESFPPKIRCTAISVSLSVAQAIFGGMTPTVTHYLIKISDHYALMPILITASMALIALTIIGRQKASAS